MSRVDMHVYDNMPAFVMLSLVPMRIGDETVLLVRGVSAIVGRETLKRLPRYKLRPRDIEETMELQT